MILVRTTCFCIARAVYLMHAPPVFSILADVRLQDHVQAEDTNARTDLHRVRKGTNPTLGLQLSTTEYH